MGMSKCCCNCTKIIEYSQDRKDEYTTSGTWTQITHGLSTTGSGQVLFNKTFNPDQPWRAVVTISVTIVGPITGTPVDMFEVKLIGGGSYLVYGVNAAQQYLLLDDAREPHSDSCNNSTRFLPGVYDATLQLCWDGTYLTAKTTSTTANIFNKTIQSTTVPTGNTFGFIVGSLHPNVSLIEFENFYLYKVNDGIHNARCEVCPVHCCLGLVPEQLLLELYNFTSSIIVDTDIYYEFSGATYHLTMLCDIFNSTYYLSQSSCTGDSNCNWTYTFNGQAEATLISDPFGGSSSTILLDYTFTISANISENEFGNRIIVVTIDLIYIQDVNSSLYIQVLPYTILEGETESPCTSWTSPIDLLDDNSDRCVGQGRIRKV